ncbi:MAG: TlyA family RNA methyltransferase [Acidobacteriota bacterium]
MSSTATAEGSRPRRGASGRRRRADLLVLAQGLASSRHKAQALILAGEIWRGSLRVEKSGERLPADSILHVRPRRRRFVGRGGEKLDGALDALGVDPRDSLVWDIGASTGGFTDCLLKRGARCVVAVDVGRGQLDASLRNDSRVILREGINARRLRPDQLPGPPSIVVVDVSFISLEKILVALVQAAPDARIVTLVKPQFEVGRGQVGRGGVVREQALQEQVLHRLCARASLLGLRPASIVESPLRGAAGNREFFVHWVPAAQAPAVALEQEIYEAVYGSNQKEKV